MSSGGSGGAFPGHGRTLSGETTPTGASFGGMAGAPTTAGNGSMLDTLLSQSKVAASQAPAGAKPAAKPAGSAVPTKTEPANPAQAQAKAQARHQSTVSSLWGNDSLRMKDMNRQRSGSPALPATTAASGSTPAVASTGNPQLDALRAQQQARRYGAQSAAQGAREFLLLVAFIAFKTDHMCLLQNRKRTKKNKTSRTNSRILSGTRTTNRTYPTASRIRTLSSKLLLSQTARSPRSSTRRVSTRILPFAQKQSTPEPSPAFNSSQSCSLASVMSRCARTGNREPVSLSVTVQVSGKDEPLQVSIV
jgi:hypothetical protein